MPMMQPRDIVAFLQTITYKPGYQLRAWIAEGGIVRFSVRVSLPDSENPKESNTVAAECSFHPTDVYKKEHILDDIDRFLRNFELHEMYEWFRVSGTRYRNPHEDRNRMQSVRT